MDLQVPAAIADLVWRHRQEVLLTNNLQSFRLIVDGTVLATAVLAADPTPAEHVLLSRARQSSR